jgi:hypothetical protein
MVKQFADWKKDLSAAGSMRFFGAIVLCFLMGACTSLPRNPLPLGEMADAQIPQFDDVRTVGFYGQARQEAFEADLVKSWAPDKPDHYCGGSDDAARVHCILVVSGGGGFGSFGAGILNGWTASGKRPNFKMVTGISTGGLIAPFAFLGSEYDGELKKAFTTIKGGADILIIRGFLKILFSESVGESKPLSNLIAKFVDEKFLAAIAREHQRGRRLYIGTTHMDAQRFVAWNMGAIASRGTPEALSLFRSVLLASASVPGLFPPVMIPVKTASGTFDEMHADGGVETQFFFPGDIISFPTVIEKLNANRQGRRVIPGNFRLFVIRNARFTADPKQVQRNLGEISGRAISTMIQAMGQSDLYRLFAVAKARGVDFNYVEVPPDFVWQSEDEFDQKEMNRLFDLGRRISLKPGFWKKAPPGAFAQNIERLD